MVTLATSTTEAAAARTRRTRAVRGAAAQWLFLVPAIAFVLLFFAYPVVQNVRMSLQDYTTATFYTGVADWVGLENYREVITGPIFLKTVTNTLLFTLGSIVGQFAIGLALAVFFTRRFPLSSALRSLLLIPWLLPVIASTAVWKWILDQDGGVLNETLRALHLMGAPVGWISNPDVALIAVIIVNVWLGIPFCATLLHSGLQEIPTELYEAASLDGSTGFSAFRHITWPNLRAVVQVVMVLNVIYTLKVLEVILGLTNGGPANATQTLATDSYRRSFQEFSFGTGAAVSNLLILVSLAFALVYLRLNRRSNED